MPPVTIDGTTGVSLVQDGVITDANLPAGSVLQVVSSIKQGIQSVAHTAGTTAITDLSVNITPSSTNSKILVQAYITSSSNNAGSMARLWRLYRNGSEISGSVPTTQSVQKGAWMKTSGVLGSSTAGVFNNDHGMGIDTGFYLDSPNSTAQQTYAIYLTPQSNGGTIHINRNGSDDNGTGEWEARSTSGILVMEIAG